MGKFIKYFIFVFVLSCVFPASGLSSSKVTTIKWNDFSSSLNKKFFVGKSKTGYQEVEVLVNLPEDLLKSAKKIPLLITAFDADHDEAASVKINGSFFANYMFETPNDQRSTRTIKIKTKHLKPGLNKLLFSNHDPRRYWYKVEKVEFQDVKAFQPKFNVILKSNPSGAHVVIDNESFSTTPFKISLMKGYHSITIEKEGYETFEGKIYVISDREISYDLEAIMKSPPEPSKTNVKIEPSAPVSQVKRPDAIAVVIGNQNYSHKDIPNVTYANNDAAAIKNFLLNRLGFKEGNIIFETDTTKAKLEMILGTEKNYRGMLYNYIKPEKSDVFIYYSGHGSPDPNTNKAYLVPIDCNPVMMDLTAYPLDVLYGNLPKIEARSITVVLDACFSGGTNTGEWLVHNASPALIKVKNPVTAQNNLTILTSSKNNQVSSWYPEKQHSMFTYFFLKAVMGDADFNKDKQITFKEIYDFVSDRAEGVPYYAKRLHGGRIQTPTILVADKNAIFVSY
jgi:Caspase domain/PEGA domain